MHNFFTIEVEAEMLRRERERGSRGGRASGAGGLIQENRELALESIPVTGRPAGAGLPRHPCWRAAGTAPCPATGRLLIERFGPRRVILGNPYSQRVAPPGAAARRSRTRVPTVRDQRVRV